MGEEGPGERERVSGENGMLKQSNPLKANPRI
jgi:hypothetical protein